MRDKDLTWKLSVRIYQMSTRPHMNLPAVTETATMLLKSSKARAEI